MLDKMDYWLYLHNGEGITTDWRSPDFDPNAPPMRTIEGYETLKDPL